MRRRSGSTAELAMSPRHLERSAGLHIHDGSVAERLVQSDGERVGARFVLPSPVCGPERTSILTCVGDSCTVAFGPPWQLATANVSVRPSRSAPTLCSMSTAARDEHPAKTKSRSG